MKKNSFMPLILLLLLTMTMTVRSEDGTAVNVSAAKGKIVTHGSVIYDSSDIRNLGAAVEAQAKEIVSFKEGLINGVRNIGLEKDGGTAPYKNADHILR